MRFTLYVFLAFSTLGVGCTTDSTTPDSQTDFSHGPVVTVASTTQAGIIEESLSDGLEMKTLFAVRSEQHEFAHYIAAEIYDASDEKGVALWFMFDGMDIPGDRFAVNSVAQSNSSLPKFLEANEKQSESLPEVQVLLNFVRQFD